VTRDSGLSWISVPFNLAQIGDFLFRIPLRYQTPVPVSFLVIGLLIVASALVLGRRVRGVEVVA